LRDQRRQIKGWLNGIDWMTFHVSVCNDDALIHW